MAIVHIRVGNREYDVACDDGQEDRLRLLAEEVDERVRSVLFSMGNGVSDTMALLLSALTLSDELSESKKEIQAAATEVAHLKRQVDGAQHQAELAQMEEAVAKAMDDIALRVEKIADQLEMQ